MNKYVVLLLVGMVFISLSLSAQTFGEFFNQKNTQKRYLLQQIGALQIYLEYAKKGYELVGSGLQTVRDITNGEFSLHSAFISSLKKVTPFVRNNAKVAEIIVCQLGIARAFDIRDKDKLSLSSQLYVLEVKDHLLDECFKDLEELLLVVTAGKVEMSDAQRLERLDKVYISMMDKYSFALDFSAQVKLLIAGGIREEQSINYLKKFYEKHE
jgi:hypothetical protein